jgi:hypothetical protein
MGRVIRYAVLALCGFGIAYTVSSAEAEKEGKHSWLFHMGSMKDAKYEVTNIPNGVTIRITSNKPDVVKEIQESMAQCRAAHQSGDHKHMCPMHKDSDSPGNHDQHSKE